MDHPSHLLIDLPDPNFKPGADVTGHVLWDLAEAPGDIRLSLGWWTEGLGTRDEAIVDSATWPAAPRIGKEEFSLRLPGAPVSVSGKLVSIVWALELVATGPDLRTVTRLVVSPTGRELDISGYDLESKGGSWKFSRTR